MSGALVAAFAGTWPAIHDVFTLPQARAIQSLGALEHAFSRDYRQSVPAAAAIATRVSQARSRLEAGQWWACASILVSECDRLWAALPAAGLVARPEPAQAPAPAPATTPTPAPATSTQPASAPCVPAKPAAIGPIIARERARQAWLAKAREEFEVRRGRESDALIRGRSPDHWFTFAVQRRGIDDGEPPHWIAVSRRTGSVEHLGPDVHFQSE